MRLLNSRHAGSARSSGGPPGLLGPHAVEVRPRHLALGDGVCRSFAVTGYPREVGLGWLAPLLEHPGRVDVALHVDPLPNDIAADRLRRQLARLESARRVDAAKGRLVDPEVDVAADDARDLSALTLLVDDQTLSGLLREEISWPEDRVFTTGHWCLRLCQAVVRGAGGALSRPLLSLPVVRREAALRAVLQLPDRVEMLSWREVAPKMASQLDGPGRGLNVLSREALAVASLLQAEVITEAGNENHLLRTALRRVGLS
jgi:hypothetical protein